MHKDLPLDTKKFVEVKSKEVIYLTPDGQMYTETENEELKEIHDLSWLAPKSIKSPQPTFKQRKKCSLSESQTTPALNPNDSQIRKLENLLPNEGFVNVGDISWWNISKFIKIWGLPSWF